MSSRPHLRLTRASVLGLVVGVLVLVLLVGALVLDRRTPAAEVPTEDPVYRENRVVAADRFERSLDAGWGEAEVGGRYDLTAPNDFHVENGTGLVALPRAAVAHLADLGTARPQDLTASVDVLAPAPTSRGSGVYVALHLRTSGSFYYRPVLRFAPDRKVYLSVSRFDGSAEDRLNLAGEKIVADGVEAGDRLTFAVSVVGTSPVKLRAAVTAGRGKPVGLEAEDTSASRLVAGGTLALWSYVAASSDADKVVGFDNLDVRSQVAETAELGTGSIDLGTVPDPGPVLPVDAGTVGRPTGSAPVGSTRYEIPGSALFVRGGAQGGDGSMDAPFGRIQQAVDAAPSGTTVVVRSGEYHESVLLPAGRRIDLQSYPGEAVWLEGSSVLDGWRRRGTAWEVPWRFAFDSSPTYTRGAKDRKEPGWQFVNPAHPMAAHPEQVWADGLPQTQVRSRKQVRDGTFFVDTARKRLVLGTDPRDAVVRGSTLDKALTIVGEGDVVRGIGVRRYATSVWQLGAATVNSRGVSLADMVFEDNATTGLSIFAADVRVQNLTATRNGLMGIHVHVADRLDVSNVVVTQNNLEQFNRAPAAGGMKLTSSAQVRIAGSEFADNLGHGLWFDASASDVDIVSSWAERNTGAGMVVEISSRVRVVDNVVLDNGVNGLWLIDTDRVQIANNTFARNDGSNLMLVTDGRSPRKAGLGGADERRVARADGMPWISRDVDVYNNLFSDGGDACAVCVVDYTGTHPGPSLDLAIDHNLYHVTGSDLPATVATWPSGGPAELSYADFEAYRAATGQDAASRVLVGGGRAVDRQGRIAAAVTAEGDATARRLEAGAVEALGQDPAQTRLGAWED